MFAFLGASGVPSGRPSHVLHVRHSRPPMRVGLAALARGVFLRTHGSALAKPHARAAVFFFGCFSSSDVTVLIERAKHLSLSCLHDVTSRFLSCILVAQLAGSLMTSACRAMRKRPG